VTSRRTGGPGGAGRENPEKESGSGMGEREEKKRETAAVIGAGAMGHGIAQVLATAGFEVALYDSIDGAAEAALGKVRSTLDVGVARNKVTSQTRDAVLDRLRPEKDFRKAVAGTDLVIEAIPEDLEAKRAIFSRLDQECPEQALLASNTSSLSLSRIASACRGRPGRVLGLHFFNPPHLMRLLEIVKARQTEPEVVTRALSLARRLGKEAIVVKDSPGFATSRLGVALGLEAMRMLEEGVASAEDIDKAMELGYGHPMGPLRVSDLVGLDVRLSIAEVLRSELDDNRFEKGGRGLPPLVIDSRVQ
jgi:3-hydroxybutyryl-CoA dehydrogenase